ncbi:MAG: hypothetical protein WCA79_17155 [Anaerolineales bacterium]
MNSAATGEPYLAIRVDCNGTTVSISAGGTFETITSRPQDLTTRHG